MSRISFKSIMSVGALCALSSTAFAGMGNVPASNGILPGDVGSAQALSMFNPNVSAIYYNPASLALDPRGELSAGVEHIRNQLGYKDGTGNGPSSGNIQQTPSQLLMIGLKTDVSSMFTTKHPMYVAVMLAQEKFGTLLLPFQSDTSATPQAFESGRQPLFLNVGFATQVWRGIDFGASTMITLQNSATLDTHLELNGQTYHESLDVSGRTEFRPIAGFTMNWGKTFCSGDCWLQNLSTAVSYRAYTDTSTSVVSDPKIAHLANGGIPLVVTNVIDNYEPTTWSLGFKYNLGNAQIGLSGNYEQWSDLNSRLSHDVIKDQAVNGGGLSFDDTVVPRLGVKYNFNDNFALITGVAWVPSPLQGNSSKNVNYVDANRWVFGLGFQDTLKNPPILSAPLTIGFGWQHQQLQNRTFNVVYTDPQTGAQNAPRSVTTKGTVDAFVGSITMKF